MPRIGDRSVYQNMAETTTVLNIMPGVSGQAIGLLLGYSGREQSVGLYGNPIRPLGWSYRKLKAAMEAYRVEHPRR